MLELLTWLEGSALGEAMRGMGVWTYGVVNLVHVLGVSTLFGSILVLDLRLLGLWPGIPLRTVATPTLPLAAAGLTLAFLSGICMIATNAIDYVDNPFLLIKFPAIGLGLLNAAVLSRLPAWTLRESREPSPADRRKLAAAGGTSLACWLAAISAGRMLGYW
ncbi:MAG: hypothetical protein OEQ25_11975 [Gammaproteobacteria bacterium]|nr:hypothetical protein [Gammaproteobacteria bacterium]MDH3507844.1 hypothetical protein [Gammaproteobacteria bacterium]